MKPTDLKSRIESTRVLDANGCWNWPSVHRTSGYGYLSVKDRQRRAHRVSYETYRGPIPTGLQLDHLCRNRACVNPDHLEAVTPLVNVQRRAHRRERTHCYRGHEFTPENSRRSGTGKTCRICGNEGLRRRRAAQRAVSA